MGLVLLWWFVVLILGFVAYPIAFVAFKNLPDKGYVFSKVLALLIMGFLSWILGYFSFNLTTIFLAFILMAALSLVLLISWIGHPCIDFIKKNLFNFIVVEAFFLIAFLVAGAYKMRTHDIVGTEKPMDFAMINGILASRSMPPIDPWLSGGSISYYYFGYFIVAMLCKITQVASGEAYNLGVALTWALAFKLRLFLGICLYPPLSVFNFRGFLFGSIWESRLLAPGCPKFYLWRFKNPLLQLSYKSEHFWRDHCLFRILI